MKETLLYSPSRNRGRYSRDYDEEEDDSGESDLERLESSGSSNESGAHEKRRQRPGRRRYRRRRGPTVVAALAGKQNSTMTVIGVFLLLFLLAGAVAAAVYFWRKSQVVDQSSTSTDSDSNAEPSIRTVTRTADRDSTSGVFTGMDRDDDQTRSLTEQTTISDEPALTPTSNSSSRRTDFVPSSSPTPLSPEVPSVPSASSNSNVKPTATPVPDPDQSDPVGSATGQTDEFVSQALAAHNEARAIHCAGPLVWNQTLEKAAQVWANKCVFEHGGGKPVGSGENLWATSAAGRTDPTEAIAKAWISDEEKLYNYNQPGFSHETGHFTQAVWIGTTSVGCSLLSCQMNSMNKDGPSSYLVCEYFPPGNYAGEYEKNVMRPQTCRTSRR